ncbi:hypothetical protein F66182_898 [Fusarium sp. NRRL 66182]|nr:hypothetical protein F66182_898 [Fusarium sp. NRRL 66182]
MKITALLTVIASLAAHTHAACTQVPDAQGNAMTLVEDCVVQRNAENIPIGPTLCAKSNAWLRNGSTNWGARVTSRDRTVVFKIVPLFETGPDPSQTIYYSCTAGTEEEFVLTRQYSFGAARTSIVQ